MGQQVAVTERPSPRPGVIRFETNRSLTGMGHEHFATLADAVGPRPAAALARQLLSTGVEIPTFDAPAPEPEPAAAAGGDTGGAAVESAYTRLVPQNLRERSAAALAKAQAGG